MKTSTFTLPFMVALITSGAEGPLRSVENLSADYADFLTNVTLQLNDAYVFEDSLDSFRKVDNYNSDTMLKALASIVNERSASTNDNDRHMARASINAMGYMQLTNALPMLRKWTLGGGELTSSSFNAFGEISGHDMSFLELAVCAINKNVLSESFVLGQLSTLMSLDNRIANGQELPQRYKLQEKVRLNMARLLINYENPSFESSMGNEEVFARCIGGYTNSIERVKAQQRINDFLIQRKEHILKKSACRTMGGNWKLSDEEWYRRATNNCQTEIARVMALPEGERLNLTAILDAKISAIETAEARATRHAVWKRRLRIGALALPIPVIALVAIVVRRRRRTVSLPPICLRISDNAFGTREAEKGRNSPWESSSTPTR
jgi:hypothetical protein